MIGSVGRDARRGLRWLVGARMISVLFNTVATFATIRLLAPEHFGLAAIASMLVGLISLVNDAGLATSLVRAPAINDAIVDRTHGLILIANVGAYALLYFASSYAESFFGFAGLAEIIAVAGLQLLIQGPIAAPSALLTRDMRFPTLACATVAEGVVGGFSTVVLAFNGAGVWSLVIGPLIGLVSRAIIVVKFVERIPRPRPSFAGMSEALRFGGTLTVSHLIWAIYSRADTIIVGRLLGSSSLGIYNVAMQIATLPMEKFAGILNTVGLASFANVQGNLPQVREKYLWICRTAAGVVLPVFWGIGAVAGEITSVVLGPRWVAATLPLLFISLSVPLRFLSTITEPVLLALGRADLSAKNVTAASVIMIPAFLIGSRWGVVGVSLAWPIGYGIFFVYRMTVSLKAIGIPVSQYWRSLVPSISAAALMFLLVGLVRPVLEAYVNAAIAKATILVFFGVITYVVATWMWNRNLVHDIRRFIG